MSERANPGSPDRCSLRRFASIGAARIVALSGGSPPSAPPGSLLLRRFASIGAARIVALSGGSPPSAPPGSLLSPVVRLHRRRPDRCSLRWFASIGGAAIGISEIYSSILSKFNLLSEIKEDFSSISKDRVRFCPISENKRSFFFYFAAVGRNPKNRGKNFFYFHAAGKVRSKCRAGIRYYAPMNPSAMPSTPCDSGSEPANSARLRARHPRTSRKPGRMPAIFPQTRKRRRGHPRKPGRDASGLPRNPAHHRYFRLAASSRSTTAASTVRPPSGPWNTTPPRAP